METQKYVARHLSINNLLIIYLLMIIKMTIVVKLNINRSMKTQRIFDSFIAITKVFILLAKASVL